MEGNMRNKRTMKEIDRILPDIKKTLKSIYGDRLLEIILYGSYARGDSTKDSDIDIAVVLKGKVNRIKEIDKIYDALYDLILESGELVSIYPLSKEEIRSSVWPLYHHIRNEGIRI